MDTTEMSHKEKYSDWYDNWSDELKAMSFPTTIMQLTDPIRNLIYRMTLEEGPTEFTPEDNILLGSFTSDLGRELRRYPNGAFLKLSSRSPKDSWHGHRKGFKVKGTEVTDAIRRLMDSERIRDDVQLPGINLLIREWCEMRPQDEWRCFQIDGRFVGISQYFYRDVFNYSQSDLRDILGIAKIAHAQIQPHIEPNQVFDLYIPPQILASEDKPDWKLIEINPAWMNPWGTDPCLFDWNEIVNLRKGKADFGRWILNLTLRYNQAQKVDLVDE
jgi:hypothetical protein